MRIRPFGTLQWNPACAASIRLIALPLAVARPAFESDCRRAFFNSLLTLSSSDLCNLGPLHEVRMLIAAATRLAEIYPDRSITAFAFIRYRGFVDEIESRIDPCIGTLTWADTDVVREP